MKFSIILLAFLATACATSSGIVQTGPNSYLISREGGGFSGLGTMKVDSIKDAGEFCKKQGKLLQVTSSQEEPKKIGTFAHSDVQFTCLKNVEKN